MIRMYLCNKKTRPSACSLCVEVDGLEPPFTVPKTVALPLDDTSDLLVGMTGFDPTLKRTRPHAASADWATSPMLKHSQCRMPLLTVISPVSFIVA